MKHLLFLFTWLMISHVASAQVSLSGKITSAVDGSSIPGAIIYVPDLKTGTSTDSEGAYLLKNLKPGNYLVEVSMLGYKSEIRKLAIRNDTLLHVELETAKKELSELIVTGVTRSTEIQSSPVIIKSLSISSLNNAGATNLIDALKDVPGINQLTTGVAISKPIIRGLGYNRVITLNNGIRQEGQQWGDEHGIEIDEYAIDRVEIVKGPGSLLYGSDGIAGVLNFISAKSPLPGDIKTQVVSNFQSNNGMFGYSVSNSGNKGGLQWQGRLSQKQAGNYQNRYDGEVYNSGFKEIDGNLFLGLNRSWGHSHLNLSTYNNTLNLVEGERDSLGQFLFVNAMGEELIAQSADYAGVQIGFPHQQVNHVRAALNNYFLLKKGSLTVDLAFQNNRRREYADPTNPEDIELYFDLNTWNYNLRYNADSWKGWEAAFGLGGMQQSNANRGEEYLIPAYSLFDAGVFGFAQKHFGKLTMALGVRYDHRWLDTKALYLDSLEQVVSVDAPSADVKFTSVQQQFQGISASLGWSYRASEISTFKLNFSRGYRAPTVAELASNGRHEGAFRYEIGNQQLKPEISHQVDLAYFLNSDHVSFELKPYLNSISNYIFVEKIQSKLGGDSIPDLEDGAPAFQYVQGNALLFGTEIYVDVHPHPLDWLHLGNSFSFVQAQQLNQPDSLSNLPFIPAPKYRLELKAELSVWKNMLSGTFIKFAVDNYFAQNRVFAAYGTETATPAYSLMSCGIGTTIKLGKKEKRSLNFLLSGDNLADVAFQNHLSRLKYAPVNELSGRTGVFNMGRNFSLKLILNL